MFFLNTIWFGYRVKGKHKLRHLKSGVITVSNHVHNMDATMNALTCCPRRPFFITLKSNFEIPISRHLVKALGGVPIPETKVALRKFSKDIEEALDKGRIIHYYPEASLWPYYGHIRPFKNGAFRLAAKKQLPIVPIVFAYRKPRGLYRLKKKPCITAFVLDPIKPTPDSNYLKTQTFDTMTQFMEQRNRPI